MPRYDFICKRCGKPATKWLRLAEYDKLQRCFDCGNILKRLISCKNIICDIEPYLDEDIGPVGSGEPVFVTSRQHKKQLLKAVSNKSNTCLGNQEILSRYFITVSESSFMRN